MTAEFSRSIRKCIDIAAELALLEQCGPAHSLDASGDFKKASRRVDYYRELYDVGTRNQDFNFMLKDQSFFQFSEQRGGEDFRFAYYPNPYSFVEYKSERVAASELLESGDITDLEFDQLISECNFTSDIPLIRYDYSPGQYCQKYHPAAHFHIGFRSENRWPVKRALTPVAFFLKILSHYYINAWRGAESPDGTNYLEQRYRMEVNACALLEINYFSEEESQRLHFV
ncbi:DUF2290 domain-containing protein [Pseudomonas piscis]|uniref:DUF2290 domain-containing protein n=1 Tax=Pseudomonas piscis TaxID=2614538 RepID=A0ABY9NAI6_9PSED|nr:DUF2290 domain-containing protein [Pseudomonas piscis]WMN15454.1 DUF2290 domain-containing protein [Pseudomonas piscis]